MSDEGSNLLQRAVEGDVSALRVLLERHGGEVRARIAGRIDRRWQAYIDDDDVMQIAYIEAFLHIDQLVARDTTSFVAWLTRIAENALRDAIRGLSRLKRPDPMRRVEPNITADSYFTLLDCLGVTTTTPSREVVKKDAMGALESAIQHLPDDYRTAVRLYDLEGRSIADVASTMGRSEGAVHMLRGRAHDCLRKSLSSSAFFSGPA